MANLDTRDKRASALGVNMPAPRLEQNPSGTIAQAGRQMAALVYSGILATVPVAVVTTVFTLIAEVSNVFGLTASPGGSFALQAERSDLWTLKGSE